MKLKYFIYLALPLLGGCAHHHQAQLHSTQEREMTLGVVQAEIRQGMSQGDVATVLGSPNIATKDRNGAETWIYDKLSSEVSYSQGKTGGIIGAVWSITGLVGYGTTESGAKAKSQKTLTVVIKFDENQEVENVSYHSSKF